MDSRMPQPISQGRAIDNLNRYLEWHNLPVRVNKSGICNGLASIYVKYVLEGKEEDFFNILNHIATMPPDHELDDQINHFVVEVVLSFDPQLFDKEQSQMQAIDNLQISGKKLASSFDLGLIASNEAWVNIFDDLNLQEDEPVLVRTLNHAVSVRKIEGGYRIYDPNYTSGYKNLTNTKDLIEELHTIAKRGGLEGPLGMNIQVIHYPTRKETSRKLPEPQEFYDKYFDPSQFITPKRSKERIDSLEFVVRTNDESALNKLLAKNLKFECPANTLVYAAIFFNENIFNQLLTRIPEYDHSDFEQVFEAVFRHAPKKAVDALLKSEAFNTYLAADIIKKGRAEHHIGAAALGGDVALLAQVIEYYKNKYYEAHPTTDKIPGLESIYQVAIERTMLNRETYPPNPECIQFLLGKLKEERGMLNEEHYIKFLESAILSNHPQIVELIINTIKNDLSGEQQNNVFKATNQWVNNNVSIFHIEKTDLSILRLLKNENMYFSTAVQGVMDLKENRPIGVLTSIGIALTKYTDYVKLQVGNFISLAHQIKDMLQGGPPPDVDMAEEPAPKL